MAATITAERLIEGCAEDSREAGIRMVTRLEPIGGAGAPIKPAIYGGGKYQFDKRWWSENGDSQVEAVVIDNVPSQANRLEAALDRVAERIGLPRIILDLSQAAPLPPHLPTQLSGYQFPHRQADAYLRDALLDGVAFAKTEMGQAIQGATVTDPNALFEWFPHVLLFGYWQSHLGRGRSQAKLARSWTSEIVGYQPAATETTQLGLKGDPLNLTLQTERVDHDPLDESDWQPSDEKKAAAGIERVKLSEIGHGQVPIGDRSPAALSVRAIEQCSSVSFAGLRRVRLVGPEQAAAGRALLVALGLVAHVDAFGGSFSLRSGCDLRTSSSRWEWLGGTEDQALEPLTPEGAAGLLAECAARAEAAGLPVGSRWADEPVTLHPNAQLLKVIRSTYPMAE